MLYSILPIKTDFNSKSTLQSPVLTYNHLFSPRPSLPQDPIKSSILAFLGIAIKPPHKNI
jgi:hypothetical protein